MLGREKQHQPEAFMAPGRPENKVDAPIDSLYLDNGCAVLWIKTTPRGAKTGWMAIGQVIGDPTPRPARFRENPPILVKAR